MREISISFFFLGPLDCILDMVNYEDSGFYYFSPASITFFKQCNLQYTLYIHVYTIYKLQCNLQYITNVIYNLQ